MTPHPQIIRAGGCPPKLLLPPSPRFSFFMNRPPPPLSGKNEGTTPHRSSSKRYISRGISGERGRGDHPTGHGLGGWGDRMKWWGDPLTSGLWDTPRPPIRNFSYRPPTSPLRAKRGPPMPSSPKRCASRGAKPDQGTCHLEMRGRSTGQKCRNPVLLPVTACAAGPTGPREKGQGL